MESAIIALILRFANSMLSMIPADDDAAYGFNVHYDRNYNQRQIDLVE